MENPAHFRVEIYSDEPNFAEILFCGERQLFLAHHKHSTTGLVLKGVFGSIMRDDFLMVQ